MEKKHIVTVVGARPQFIKAAIVSQALSMAPNLRETLIHTGQHYDSNMSADFFDQLKLPNPIMLKGATGSSEEVVGNMANRLNVWLHNHKSSNQVDMILCYGDTNSTLAAAMVAKHNGIALAHVEAGLRSFNVHQIEEMNRQLTDKMSDLLFPPTQDAQRNIQDENLRGKAVLCGDVMYDLMLKFKKTLPTHKSVCSKFGLKNAPYYLITLHRGETLNDPAKIKYILDYVRNLAQGTQVLFPIHPHTQKVVAANSISLNGYQVIPPIGYGDMQACLQSCKGVFTDSGGLQKEAYYHRKPVVILRRETEWTELVDSAWAKFLDNAKDMQFSPTFDPNYGNGKSGEKIIGALEDYLN